MFPLRDTQPSYSRPVITVLLIVLNVLIFLFEVSLDAYSRNHFIAAYGLTPARFQLEDLVTSMFLHGGWMHLIGNMWFLWVFGDNIEDILGSGKFLLFYLACGVAAAFAQILLNPGSRVPMVGASGAIAGVMGAYMVKFPHARVLTLVFVFIFVTTFEVPAWAMLLYWFAIQFVSGVGSVGHSHVSQGGVAFFAHIGGFIAGILFIQLLGAKDPYQRRRDLHW